MATSKTLTPTNVTISIPAMTDRPNQSVNSNCIDKLADAVNDVHSKKAIRTWTGWNTTIESDITGATALVSINSNLLAVLWIPSTSDISVLVMSEDAVFRKAGTNGSVTFGTTSAGTNYTITRNGNHITITSASEATIKVYT